MTTNFQTQPVYLIKDDNDVLCVIYYDWMDDDPVADIKAVATSGGEDIKDELKPEDIQEALDFYLDNQGGWNVYEQNQIDQIKQAYERKVKV